MTKRSVHDKLRKEGNRFYSNFLGTVLVMVCEG